MEQALRMFIWSITSLVVYGVVSWSWKAGAEETTGVRFPKVEASNLDKRQLHLPGDFEGDRNLLLVAFERHQQKDVDTWLREMKGFEELDPNFRYYELPTIERPNVLTRWFIDSGMRRGIPDRRARERTITLYLDKKLFCEALQIPDQKKIYEFLVNRNGEVLWRSDGLFDQTKSVSLRRAIGKDRA